MRLPSASLLLSRLIRIPRDLKNLFSVLSLASASLTGYAEVIPGHSNAPLYVGLADKPTAIAL